MTQNRFRSPVVWATVTAQILAVLVTLEIIDTGLSEALNALAAAALQILGCVGILNNPTDAAHF